MATLTRKNFKNFKRRVCNRPVTPNLACPWVPRVVPSPARKNFKNFKNFHRSQGKYEGWGGRVDPKERIPLLLKLLYFLKLLYIIVQTELPTPGTSTSSRTSSVLLRQRSVQAARYRAGSWLTSRGGDHERA